jgi:hypothetical protein
MTVIDLRPMKAKALNFPEPLKSIIEIQKDTMSEKDFVDFFINLRRKAREMDTQNKEAKK